MKNGSRYVLVCFFFEGTGDFRQEMFKLQGENGREAVQQAKTMVGDLGPQSFEVRAVTRNVHMVIYRSGIRLVA